MAKVGEVAVCEICGKLFNRRTGNQKYCCTECGKEANRRNVMRLGRKYRSKKIEQGRRTKKKVKESQKKIDELAVEARKHGMSYGQYVGLKDMVRHKFNEVR